MKLKSRLLCKAIILALSSFLYWTNASAQTQPAAQTQPSIIDNMGYYLFSFHTSEDNYILTQTAVDTFVRAGFNKMVVKGYYPYDITSSSYNHWDVYMGNRINILKSNNIHPVIAPEIELRPDFIKQHLGSLQINSYKTNLQTSVNTWLKTFGRDGVADILYDIEEPPSAMTYIDAYKDGMDDIDGTKIFLSQSSEDDASPLGYNIGYAKLVQIFHPTGRYLGHVTLKAKIIGTPDTIKVSYWSVDTLTGRPKNRVSELVSVIPKNFSTDVDENNYRSVTVYFHTDPDRISLEKESNKGDTTSTTIPKASSTKPIYLSDKMYALVVDCNGSYSTSNYYSFAGTSKNTYNHPIDGINTCLSKYDSGGNWTSYSNCDLYFDFYGRMTTVDHEGKDMHTGDWAWSNGYTFMPSDEWVAKKNSQINDIVSELKNAAITGYQVFLNSNPSDSLLTDINTIGNKGSNETDSWPLGYSEAHDKLMQVFRPKYSNLRKVIVRMTKIGNPAAIEVSIQELNSLGKPSGTKIATASISSSSIPTANVYQNVSVNISGVSLDTRKYYAVVFDYAGTNYQAQNYYQFSKPSVYYNLGYTAMCDAGGINWRDYGKGFDLAFSTKFLQAPNFIVYSGYGNKNYYNHDGRSENEAFGVDWGTMKDYITVVNAGETELTNNNTPAKTRQVIGQLPLWTHLWNDYDASKSKIDVTSSNIGAYIDKQLEYSFFPVGLAQRQSGGLSYGTNISDIFTSTYEKDIFPKMAEKWSTIIPNEKKYIDSCIFMSATPADIIFMGPWQTQQFSTEALPNDGRLKYYWSTNPAIGPFSLSWHTDGSSNVAYLQSNSPSVSKYGLTVNVKIVDSSFPTRSATNSFQVFIYGSGIAYTTKEPLEYSLAENYPNPFNPATKINYQLKAGGFVRLAVYDILGREVALLEDEYQEAGTYNKLWDAASFASGIYIYNLTVKDNKGNLSFSQTKRMLLVK